MPRIPSIKPSPKKRPISIATRDGDLMPSAFLIVRLIPLAISRALRHTALAIEPIPLISPRIKSLPTENKFNCFMPSTTFCTSSRPARRISDNLFLMPVIIRETNSRPAANNATAAKINAALATSTIRHPSFEIKSSFFSLFPSETLSIIFSPAFLISGLFGTPLNQFFMACHHSSSFFLIFDGISLNHSAIFFHHCDNCSRISPGRLLNQSFMACHHSPSFVLIFDGISLNHSAIFFHHCANCSRISPGRFLNQSIIALFHSFNLFLIPVFISVNQFRIELPHCLNCLIFSSFCFCAQSSMASRQPSTVSTILSGIPLNHSRIPSLSSPSFSTTLSRASTNLSP